MQMKKWTLIFAALLLMLPLSSYAQTQTTNTIVTQSPPAQPPSASPPELSSSDGASKPQNCNVQRYYPPVAMRLGQEGTTVLGFTIAIDGSVQDVRVITSSGSEALDDAAMNVAACWHYKPALQNGQPIAAPWHAKVVWSLTGANH
jgi:protein TonB